MSRHTYQGTQLLYNNEFIRNSYTEVSPDFVSNYKKYREKKNEEAQKKEKIETAQRLNARAGSVGQESGPVLQPTIIRNPKERLKWVEFKRKIFIDSRHRNKVRYPEPADFVISWGRVYQNVKNMKLVSLEFPNVIQAISEINNGIYHVNMEDIELDWPYPVYTTFATPGSYNLTGIQEELTAKLKKSQRRAGQPYADGSPAIRHLFIVEVSQETDRISFTSIIPQNAPTNPITTTSGSPLILFQQQDHGYKQSEKVHVIGVQGIIGGLQGSDINGAYRINKLSENSFSFEISTVAQSTASGGGTLVRTGREAPFQFLFGNYSNPIADILGFPVENSSETIFNSNPITSNIVIITDCIPEATQTQIVAPEHKLRVGDRIHLYNFVVTPSVYEDDRFKGDFTVTHVPSPDTFTIACVIEHITDISAAFVGTQTFSMYYPSHGFNRIAAIEQIGPNRVQITTLLDHYFDEKSTVRLTNTDSVPSVDGFYHVQPLGSDTFAISSLDLDNPVVVDTPGHSGILTTDHIFYLYNVTPFGGFTSRDLNNTPFVVRDIIDEDTFTFTGHYGFSKRAEVGGGNIRINSRYHGWRGTQENYYNDKLFKPVKLSGDNYCFMCIPGLNSDSISSSGPVKNIFAKIEISALPGCIIFNEFDSSLIDFAVPIKSFAEARFVIKDADNHTVSFNGLDYSFGLELTEVLPQPE